ncbi:hypothetical protein GLYMA_19G123700v4 [Glycine max]|uniref:Enoyl-CoA hydratase n=2 Tax=Glycine subgen. Soja TaxID=1462606 RepID=A0A0R0EL70_SOYBN|nr:hypothetical protein GYH30_052847 [Glycine max]KRG95001.1 hypothetical protein GLYMA_19G123700v4 [Glycine max]RZB47614.1 Delta(3,5)-Delta(2,4)-dienoyl-CoA isomerase, peroxisomal [Glycine soja]
MQDAVTALERCRKPVTASIQGACIGGGIDIVTACDIRMCTEAFFSMGKSHAHTIREILIK